MSVVRFRCLACSAEFPPSEPRCPGCGAAAERRAPAARPRTPLEGADSHAPLRWSAGILTLLASAGAALIAVNLSRDSDLEAGTLFFAVATLLFGHVGVATLRKRPWAGIAGMVLAALPATLGLVRAIEAFLPLPENLLPYQEAIRRDGVVFIVVGLAFGVLFLLHLKVWLRRDR